MKIKFYKQISVLACAFLLCAAQNTIAQPKKLKVLFIGNSFTEANLMPMLVRNIATNVGDTLIVDWSTPGGMTFEDHAKDLGTYGKISVGDWNYVVLQEQSQKPALSDADVAANVFPYAADLDSIIHEKNKCARSVFFQTWGYKLGDAVNCPSYPPVCTYEGMDSLLERRYRQMAMDNDGIISPVGMVFTKIKDGMPSLELYSPDGMHPSEAGSYAAAVTFYTILFGKDPSAITFNYSLFPAQADFVRQVVLLNVYAKLNKFFVGDYAPDANFTYSVAGNVANFNSATSAYVANYNWNFGDGGTSTLANPSHTYAAPGTYTVRLIGDDCTRKDTTTQSVTITSTGGIQHLSALSAINIYPNPASSVLNLESKFPMPDIKLSITNMLGATVMGDINFAGKPVNIEGLTSGIYLVQLKDAQSGETITRKFVKN